MMERRKIGPAIMLVILLSFVASGLAVTFCNVSNRLEQ